MTDQLKQLSEAATLINRLRGVYAIGPDVDGGPEFGHRDFGSTFTPRIQLEAADRIETLETQLTEAKARAAIAALPQNRVPVPTDGNHDEALGWITSNCIAIRRDNGDLDYSLGQMVKAFEAGIAALPPAVPPTTPDPVSEAAKVLVDWFDGAIVRDYVSMKGTTRSLHSDTLLSWLRALTKDGEDG